MATAPHGAPRGGCRPCDTVTAARAPCCRMPARTTVETFRRIAPSQLLLTTDRNGRTLLSAIYRRPHARLPAARPRPGNPRHADPQDALAGRPARLGDLVLDPADVGRRAPRQSG